MLKYREAWNPRSMPESDSVRNLVSELIRTSDKSDPVRLRTPRTEERMMFGTDVTQCKDVRNEFSNKVENPWSHREKNSRDETEELKKLITRILNRVSDKNYEALSNEMLQSNLDVVCQDAEVLREIVAMFFQKAVNEKVWAHIYGRMCKDVCQHWATPHPSDSTPGKESTPTSQSPIDPKAEAQTFCSKFRRQLLNQCQEEFERGIKLQKELNLLPPEEKEMQEMKLRQRTMANMKFVGELYKHNLITERIMHQVMFSLLFPTHPGEKLTDEGLELFCELMDTVGKQLDRPKAQQYMAQYFQQVGLLSQTYKTARVRFKLQNLLDLRKNNWVREEVVTPITDQQAPSAQLSQQDSRSAWSRSGGNADHGGNRGYNTQSRDSAHYRREEAPPPPRVQPAAPTKAVMTRPSGGGTYQAPSSRARQEPAAAAAAPVPSGTDSAPAVTRTQSAPSAAKPTVPTMKKFNDKEWLEKINLAFQEEDTPDMLKTYDEEDRYLFVVQSLTIMCSSVQKFAVLRGRLGPVLGECVRAKVLDPSLVDRAAVELMTKWIECDEISDKPKLWECWAECVASLVQHEVTTESLLNCALDTYLADEEPDSKAVGHYIKTVNAGLVKSDVSSGSIKYFRTMNCVKRPELLKELLTAETAEPALRLLETFQGSRSNQVTLEEAKDLTCVARTAGVLCTQAFLEIREAQDTARVCKRYKDLFTKVVDSRNVKERSEKELAIVREAEKTWRVMGKADAYLQEMFNFLLSNHTVSSETIKQAKVMLTTGKLLSDLSGSAVTKGEK